MGIEILRNRIDLVSIPFTERGSRILLFRQDDQFSLRLAERWAKWEGEVGHYRKRPPLITELTFLSETGAPLAVEELETYPHCVYVRTSAGEFAWTFLDAETLLIRLPAGRYGMSFTVYAQRGMSDWRGGVLHSKRNVAYTTNAHLVDNELECIDADHFHARLVIESRAGDAMLLNITPRLGYNRSVPDPNQAIESARRSWDEWLGAAPRVLDEYRAQYAYAWWIMRSGLVNTRYYFTREALYPSKIHYVGVWHWDQVFHSLAYRHVDTRLAEDQLRIVLDHQREDGMLPDAIHDEGLVTYLAQPVSADVTKPPIITWAVLKSFESSGHLDFVKEVYEPLVRWNAWWLRENHDQNGLCQYRHPFSSGLDDSPLWDHGMPATAPDLNTYLVLQNRDLAQLSRLIGKSDAALQFDREADRLMQGMLAHLWDEETGLFRAQAPNQPVPTLTPFSLLPLLTGDLPEAVTQRLIDHLTDPLLFWTPFPIPTVAVTDPAFDPVQMWRGPVWINVNYFFVEALRRVGRSELAAELRHKTLDLMLRHSDIYEYYSPLTGKRPPKAAPMFGWSAALFIELAIQETHWRSGERGGA
ncbi:MAG: trehalase family glycosidase [Anaerolineae bacterium]